LGCRGDDERPELPQRGDRHPGGRGGDANGTSRATGAERRRGGHGLRRDLDAARLESKERRWIALSCVGANGSPIADRTAKGLWNPTSDIAIPTIQCGGAATFTVPDSWPMARLLE